MTQHEDEEHLSVLMHAEYDDVRAGSAFSGRLLATLAQPHPAATEGATRRRGSDGRKQRSAWRPSWIAAAAVAVIVVGLVFGVSVLSGRRSAPEPGPAAHVTTPSVVLSAAGASADPVEPSTPASIVLAGLPVVARQSGLLPMGAVSMPWRLAEIDTTRTSLTIYFATGDGYCIKPVGVFVSETPTAVIIEVASSTAVSAGATCPSRLELGRSVIALAAPLGARVLLHPAVSPDFVNALTSF